MIVGTLLSACQANDPLHQKSDAISVLIERPVHSLNPRHALDAPSQRIGALIFAALTRIDNQLQIQPDLAKSWSTPDGGKTWNFEIRTDRVDHQEEAITPTRIVACLENYRSAKPLSRVAASLDHWVGVRAAGNSVIIDLSRPDVYFPKNLSLLRYYRTKSSASPCAEPLLSEELIGSGDYWPFTEGNSLLLHPKHQGLSSIQFTPVRDESTRTLMLLRGQAEVAQNNISLSRQRWLENKPNFRLLEKEGTNVSYLAFNLNDPILRSAEVRKAIALAIDRESIVRHKMFGIGSIANSLVHPKLPEGSALTFPHDPQLARSILDGIGLKPDSKGVRFQLVYITTPVREGIETALTLQDQLQQVGVDLRLDVLEPAVFTHRINSGSFQLYSSRWIGVSDGSILNTALHSAQPRNRVRYQSPEVDQWLELAMAEPRLERRAVVLGHVQKRMLEDLPYFPLWYWNTTAVTQSGLEGLDASDLSMSGAFEPLSRLRRSTK